MTDRYTKYIRSVLLGFFICVAIAGVLVVVRIFIPSFLHYRWNSEGTARHANTEQLIRETFQNRVQELTRVAEQVSIDTLLTASIKLNDISAVLKAFQTLDSYRLRDDQTLELVNSNGNILVWNGQSVTPLYEHMLGLNLPERFVRVTQNGLRTYLTIGIALNHKNLYLLVSELLEVNSPISNRFVQKVSMCEKLSQKLRTQVTLKLPQTYIPRQREYCIPIADQEGKTIAEFFVEERSVDGKIASYLDTYSMMIALCLACGSIFLACACTLWSWKKQQIWITAVFGIMALWSVRLIWRELDFPANIIGGWLFNPNLYASPFSFGLSASLGELSISTVTVLISAWLCLSIVLFDERVRTTLSKIGLRIGRLGAIAFMAALALLSIWFFRGFCEALRSFVFDSTIRYDNPSDILLEGTVAIMHFNILVLGVSFLCLSIALLWAGREILSAQFTKEKVSERIIFYIILILSIPVFLLIDGTSQAPLFSLFLFMTFSVIFLERMVIWNKSELDSSVQKWRIAVWFVAGSFFIGTPILHQKLQQKEHKEIEAAATEYLRPSDSWLTFVVQDGLRTSADDLLKEINFGSMERAKETHLSFILWTQTLLGKEGYNSALILYDDKGNETDRFVVGMSKPEQQEILTQTFAGEENAVHVIERTEQRTRGKLYGAWVTVIDSGGHLVGSIALLLSEHQKTIFHEEEAEPLRQFGDRLENNAAREIAVHEFRNDSLIFSTGRKLYPDRFLTAAVEIELKKSLNDAFWKDITINGYTTQTVFVRDASSSERIVAVSLEELDFRWGLFAYLKELFIPLALLAIVGIFVFIRSGFPTFGFRGKLLLGFSCITLVPLAILSYYNKQLTTERVQERIETTLYSELNQLQDRISTYVSDEEDFVYGVDDDFCEALAAEYGIDFSVYRDAFIQASSRSELYRASFLDGRLSGKVYSSIMLDGKSNVLATERIGSVEYIVGYAPLTIAGNVVGVIAIPTLNRQQEIEAELAQRNAYVFGAYAIVFGLALVGGGLLAFRFARPLKQLTIAAKDVAEGNMDVNVEVHSRDEIGTLARSFNEMVSKLRSSRAELAKHERESAWKEMAKQIAHEIRNPLTPIKLSIQHLRQAFKDKAPEREEILQRVTQTVVDQIEALSRIASEFSSFAKMPEIKFERFNINDLLRETTNLFREVIGIVFIERLLSDSIMVVADRDQLRGVFVNIIRNAIQAMEKGGTITVETVLERKSVLVRITDTGLGIPEEIRSKIFEPNFSTKTEGMGLGLAIARRVIEDHGGTIFCQSERGRGTMFEIRLPV
jgi:signal transduction histidine kinase